MNLYLFVCICVLCMCTCIAGLLLKLKVFSYNETNKFGTKQKLNDRRAIESINVTENII